MQRKGKAKTCAMGEGVKGEVSTVGGGGGDINVCIGRRRCPWEAGRDDRRLKEKFCRSPGGDKWIPFLVREVRPWIGGQI